MREYTPLQQAYRRWAGKRLRYDNLLRHDVATPRAIGQARLELREAFEHLTAMRAADDQARREQEAAANCPNCKARRETTYQIIGGVAA